MNIKLALLAGICAFIALGPLFTASVAADSGNGTLLASKTKSPSKVKVPSQFRSKLIARGVKTLSAQSNGGTQDAVPQATSLDDIERFVANCDLNDGGLSMEEDPDEEGGVVLDCSYSPPFPTN